MTKVRLEAADEFLPGVNEKKLVFPRVNVPVDHEGIVRLWGSAAREAGGKLDPWDDRVGYLKGWDANVLSGYDPDFDHVNGFDLAVVSLYYDKVRQGSYEVQRTGLERLQAEFPDVRVGIASLGDGAILAHRSEVKANRPDNYGECHVRQIDIEPQSFDGVVSVPYGSVRSGGGANVDRSDVGLYDTWAAARVLVR